MLFCVTRLCPMGAFGTTIAKSAIDFVGWIDTKKTTSCSASILLALGVRDRLDPTKITH